MGRYSEYFQDIWKLQANRKVLGLTLFGVIYENSTPFTPGNKLTVAEGVAEALSILSKKGYDFLIIAGQPPSKTRNLDQVDFENILGATRELMQSTNSRIKNAYYAPGTDKNDPYVKPNTGMFERAGSENQLTWEEIYYVGAEINDVKAATKMKAMPILIKSPSTKTKAFELTHQIKVNEFGSLLEFAKSLDEKN